MESLLGENHFNVFHPEFFLSAMVASRGTNFKSAACSYSWRFRLHINVNSCLIYTKAKFMGQSPKSSWLNKVYRSVTNTGLPIIKRWKDKRSLLFIKTERSRRQQLRNFLATFVNECLWHQTSRDKQDTSGKSHAFRKLCELEFFRKTKNKD